MLNKNRLCTENQVEGRALYIGSAIFCFKHTTHTLTNTDTLKDTHVYLSKILQPTNYKRKKKEI